MQRMGVVERTVAASETRRARDRALDIGARATDGALETRSLSEACGDRRGEGATGTVGVPSSKAGAFPNPGALRCHQHIRHGFSGEVPAFDQHGPATERKQSFAGGLHLGNTADRRAAQDLRFRQIWGHNISL